MNRPKKPPTIDKDIQERADLLAEEIIKFDSPLSAHRKQWMSQRITRLMSYFENRLAIVFDSSEKKCMGGFAGWMASILRQENIHAHRGYGWKCQTCDDAENQCAATLFIGNHSARLALSMCRKCLERLADVIDRRLEDKVALRRDQKHDRNAVS